MVKSILNRVRRIIGSGKHLKLKNSPKPKNNIKESLLLMVVLIGIVLAVGVIVRYQNFMEEKKITVEQEELAAQHKIPGSVPVVDFPSAEAGTLVGTLHPRYFKEPLDNIIVLFASVKVPGLMLTYYPENHKIIGGTPQMVAEGITLFDGVPHELLYSFHEGGQQIIMVDRKVVAASNFVSYRNPLTGAVVGVSESIVSPAWEKVEISYISG